MSQQEVVHILKKKYPRWLTVKEIADGLQVIRNSISTNMCRLRKSESVRYRMRVFNKKMSRRPMMEYQYKK